MKLKILDEHHEQVDEIARATGAVGLSYAVIQQGKPVSIKHVGYRDLESKTPPDNDTRYNINSLTKAIVAALVGIAVHKGDLNWATKIKDVLPDFSHKIPMLEDHLTITDLLSHRSGIRDQDRRWLGQQNSIINDPDNLLKIIRGLSLQTPFRDGWTYFNGGYDLVALILTRQAGKPLHTLFRERLFRPLAMSRTSTSWDEPAEDGNSAKAYSTIQDGTPVQHERPLLGEGTFAEAAGGVKSTIKDMITWVQAWLECISESGRASVDANNNGNPLREVDWITSAHSAMVKPSTPEQNYGAGWARVQLPGPLGFFGPNCLLPKPIVGKGSPSQLVLYHHGCMPGSLSMIYLLPETKSAVIVLGNSTAMCDYTDYIGQLLVEALLVSPQPNDYVALAREHSRLAYEKLRKIQSSLDGRRKPDTMTRDLSAYIGTYWTIEGDFCIHITEHDGQLHFSRQNSREDRQIKHLEHDSFTWFLGHDDLARHAELTWTRKPDFYVFDFFTADEDQSVIKGLWWAWTEDNDQEPRGAFWKAS